MEKLLKIGDTLNSRYVVKECIGQGSFGRVYKVTDKNKNSDVAMKVIRILTTYRLMRISEEVKLWNKIKELDPENKSCIVLHHDYFQANGNAFMVFELMEKSLKEYIQGSPSTSMEVVQKVGLQILHALEYLVSAKVIRADLKPDNIMFKNVSTLEIKVIDLGNHLNIGRGPNPLKFAVLKYRPPESILFLPYNFGADIWSLGCILYELKTGRALFDGRSPEEQLYRMTMTLGKIPDELLLKGRKTNDFYIKCEETKSYSLKEFTNCRGFELKSLEDRLTESPGDEGVAKGNCPDKLKAFLELLRKMLKYDQSERITATGAKDLKFFETMKTQNLEIGGYVKAG